MASKRAAITPLHMGVLRDIHQNPAVTACEIGERREVSTYTVHEAIGSLWVDGLLSVTEGLPRGHYLTEAGAAAIGVEYIPHVSEPAARPAERVQLRLFGEAA